MRKLDLKIKHLLDVAVLLCSILLSSFRTTCNFHRIAMSSSPDPQTWVFPPLGAKDPPTSVAAIFGPVAKGDKIDLVWTPASEEPDIALLCTNGDRRPV